MADKAAKSAAPIGAATARPVMASRSLRGSTENRPVERIVRGALAVCGLISVATTFAIIAVLIGETLGFFAEVSPVEFFTGTVWTPTFQNPQFGVLPLVVGTLQIALFAMLVSVPIGLASAIYLAMYAPPRVRAVIKPALEILAGIPTVVYGYFALTFITPVVIKGIWSDAPVFNALSAGIAVGIMTVPMVSSLSEDALQAVPRSLRDGALALGATKFEVSTRVMVPAALSGIMASIILAFSRAIGETMIVVIAAGATPKFTFNPLESIQTMTGFIVQISLGDTPRGTIEYKTLFAVGFTLFLITLLMNVLSAWVTRRFREVYE
ncbi:MAG TPA: phosphate ABC transporter permease subunit PstC [Thermomicrobiales bacterium]|nr:phosphate ABC transporter permease subunit PstC [Thermomicrobiales bacterium]